MPEISSAEVIASALKQLAKIGAYNIITSPPNIDKNNKDKIIMLNRLGFENDEIASIVGTSSGTVSNAISRHKTKP